MKIRFGFVSNSSSTSFYIPLQAVNEKQFQRLQEYAESDNPAPTKEGWHDSPWSIKKTRFFVVGTTSMSNGAMAQFLSKIRIPKDAVIWVS